MQHKEKTTESVLVIVLVLLVFYLFTKNSWLVQAALSVGILGLLSKTIANGFHWIFSKLTQAIAWVNSHILLGLIFYSILVPLAFFYRLSKKDFLKIKRQKKSLYKERNQQYQPSDLEKMW